MVIGDKNYLDNMVDLEMVHISLPKKLVYFLFLIWKSIKINKNNLKSHGKIHRRERFIKQKVSSRQ